MNISKISARLVRPRYQEELDQHLESLGHKVTNTLVYYGIPELTWEFSKAAYAKYQNRNLITGLIDGQGLKAEGASSIDCLIQLRKDLGPKGIDFSCFDIAYWCYWVGKNPQLVLDSVDLSKALGRQEKLNQIFETLSAGQGLDLSKLQKQMGWAELDPALLELIPHALADLIKLVEEGTPFGVFIAKLSWFFIGMNEKRRQWWITRGSQDLRELKEECISPFDIAERLPLFFARDVKHHLQRMDLPDSQQCCMIFIDDLTALLDNKQRCLWLETLLSQKESSPYVLWVISTQKPIEWLNHATSKPLLPMTDEESHGILKHFDIPPATAEFMVEWSQGSPLNLNLAITEWQEQVKNQFSKIHKFQKHLANRFDDKSSLWTRPVLRHLGVFSIVQCWDLSIFQGIQEQFIEIDLKIPAEKFHELPYILESNQKWSIHPIFRNELIEQSLEQEQQEIHQWLCEFYHKRCLAGDNLSGDIQLLLEHAFALKPQFISIQWVVDHLASKKVSESPQTVLEILKNITEQDWLPKSLRVTAARVIGQTYIEINEWEQSIPPLEEAIEMMEEIEVVLEESHHIFNLVSQSYLEVGGIFDANNFALQALERMQTLLPSNHPDLIALQLHRARIAKSQNSSSKQREAQALCNQALEMMSKASLEPEEIAQFKFESAQLKYTQHTIDDSLHLCEQVVEQVKGLNLRNDLGINSRVFLGNLYQLKGANNFVNAFQQYEDAIEIAEEYYSPDNQLIQSLLELQLKLCQRVGDANAALLIEERLKFPQLMSGKSTVANADSLSRVGLSLQEKGNYGKAEPLLKRALLIRQYLLSDEHPDVASSLNNLASLYDNQGRYEEAEPLLRQALGIRQKLLGNEHLDVASSLNNLGSLYNNQGRYEEAEPLLRQALGIRQKLLGNEHPDVATSLNNLGSVYDNKAQYKKAESLYIEALRIRKKVLEKDHSHIATSLNNLALLYERRGYYTKAEPLFLDALKIQQYKFGIKHPAVAVVLNNLAALYVTQSRYTQAEDFYKETLTIYEENFGIEHPSIATSLNNLAHLYEKQERYKKAEIFFKMALEMRQKLLGSDHPDFVTSLNNLAYLYQSMGCHEKGEPLLKRAMEIYELKSDFENLNIVKTLTHMAYLRCKQHCHSEAEILFQKSLAITRKILGDHHPDTANSLHTLASFYHAFKRIEEAESLYALSVNIFQQTLGSDHANTQIALNNFKYCLEEIIQSGRGDRLSDHPMTQAILKSIREQS